MTGTSRETRSTSRQFAHPARSHCGQALDTGRLGNRVHPADWPMFRRKLVEHLKGETARFVCDVRYRTEDGTWRWARQHGVAYRGTDGRAKRLVGAAGDITEIKQREFELQAAQTSARDNSPRPRSIRATPNRATRWRWSRSASAQAPMTSISTPAWSISPLPSSRCSTCRNTGRSASSRRLSIPTTGRNHVRMISALYKGEIPGSTLNSAIKAATAHGAGRASTASRCAIPTAARAAWSA